MRSECNEPNRLQNIIVFPMNTIYTRCHNKIVYIRHGSFSRAYMSKWILIKFRLTMGTVSGSVLFVYRLLIWDFSSKCCITEFRLHQIRPCLLHHSSGHAHSLLNQNGGSLVTNNSRFICLNVLTDVTERYPSPINVTYSHVKSLIMRATQLGNA